MVRLGDRVTARRPGFSPRAGRVTSVIRSAERPTAYVVAWRSGSGQYWGHELSAEITFRRGR